MAEEFNELYDALIKAFEPDSLVRMVRFKLNRRLEEITRAEDFQQVVFELISRGEHEGWIQDLVRGAYEFAPDKPALKQFVAAYYPDLLPPQTPAAAVTVMAELAEPDAVEAAGKIEAKRAANEYDVFLCHNSRDKAAVRHIADRLTARGILPWFDERELQPGLPWQDALENQIENIKSAAVFIGPQGQGPWQNMELRAIINQFVQRRCPAIPVILPECPDDPILPLFLQQMQAVDFRKNDPDPLAQLIWGITGIRGDRWIVPAGPIPHCRARFLREDHSLVFVDRRDFREAISSLANPKGPKILVVDSSRPRCGKSHSWELIRFVTTHLDAHRAAYIDFKEESYTEPDHLVLQIGRRLHAARSHLQQIPKKAAQEPRWIDELCNWLIDWIVEKEITAWVVLDSIYQVEYLTDSIASLIQKLAYRAEFTEEKLRLVLLAYEVNKFPINMRLRICHEMIPEPIGKIELEQFFDHLFQTKEENPDPALIEDIVDWILDQIEQRALAPDEKLFLLSPVIREAERRLFG